LSRFITRLTILISVNKFLWNDKEAVINFIVEKTHEFFLYLSCTDSTLWKEGRSAEQFRAFLNSDFYELEIVEKSMRRMFLLFFYYKL
jgi:hypothetical protein